MQRFLTIFFFIASLMAISACGIKGPLYLPDEQADSGQDAPEVQTGDNR